MKTKLMAIVLCILMLVQPTMAIGMVGMESAEEIVTIIPEEVQEEATQEAEVMGDIPEMADNVLFWDDFENREVGDINTTAGGGVNLYPVYVKSGAAAVSKDTRLGKTDGGAYTDSTTGAVYKGNAKWDFVEDAEHGKVVKIGAFNGNNNDIGFDLNSIDFSEPGIYKFYFEMKQELGSKDILDTDGVTVLATATSTGVNGCWGQTYFNGVSNGSFQNPMVSATNTKNNLGNWFPVVFTYIVTGNPDGTITTRKESTGDNWTPDGITTAAGEGVTRLRNYFNYTPAKTGYGYFYLDDIKLTYDAAATVTYKNEAGATLMTEKPVPGTYELATKAELGTSYYPAYFIDGEEYIANKITLEAGQELTVTVKPNSRLFYEGFETGFELNTPLKVPHTAETSYTRAKLNGTFLREGRTEYVESGDESVSADGTIYSNQNWTVVEQASGNKALKITAQKGRYDSAGLKFQQLDISKAGTYILSFDAAEVEGSGGTWGDGQGSTEFGQPSLGGVVANAEAYKHIEYTIVATDNGDGTFNYTMTNNTNSTTKTYSNVAPVTKARQVVYFSVSSTTGNLEVYIDNIEFIYGQAVNVTYTDKAGTTLTTVASVQGKDIVLKSSTVGYNYAAQYTIDGKVYYEGETYKVPADSTGVTIKVERFSWANRPAEVPANAIFYENFDHTGTLATVLSPMTWFDDTYFTHTVPTFGSYGGARVYDTFQGKNVMKITNSSQYHGVRMSEIDLNKPGKYTATFHAYIDTPNGVGVKSDGVTPHYESTANWYDPSSTVLSGTGSNFAASGKLHGQWNDFTTSVIVNETDGVLTVGTKTIDYVDNLLWYMNWNTTSATKIANIYIDYAYITYNDPVKVTVLGMNGETLKTYDAYQNDKVWLPYVGGVYAYNGNTYESGSDFAIPADAQGEIVLRGTRAPMPSTVPANTVLYEDFQNRVVGDNIASSPVKYTTEAFDGSKIYNVGDGSRESAKYEYAPDDNKNVTMKIVATSMYGSGVYVDIPNDIPTGKYTVVNHFWVDNDELDANDVDGDGNTTEYLHSISEWCRVWYAAAADGDDGYIGASVTEIFDTADTRKTWNEYSFDFEVYEEDGVKYVGMYSNDSRTYETHALVGQDLYIKLHNTVGNSASGSVAFYHDDVYITYEAPVEISFVDENGESFAFTQDYNNMGTYTLPYAEEMGIDYLVEFVGEDGKTYYPGMTYTFEEAITAAEFVVKKTNVILFEEYDGSGDTQPTYKAGHLVEDASLPAGSVKGHKSFVWQNRTSGSTQYVLQDLKLDTPGVYTFTADCTLEVTGGTVPASYVQVAFQHSSWSAMRPRIDLTEEKPYTQISGTLTVTEGEDGQLYFHHSGNGTKKLVSDYEATNYHVFGMKVGFDMGTYPEGTADADKKKYGLRFENFKVTFDEYAPVNTGKASYRELNADNQGGPEGIRFAAYVTNGQRTLASEYGFVVTRKSMLTTDGVTDYTKLNLKGIDSVSATVTTTGKNSDGVTVVAAAAYNGTVDRVYVQDGKVFGLQGLYDTFFTAVLYGLDTDLKKSEVFVARPYAKIDGIYYYGDCHETSYNDVKSAADAANA